MKHARRSTLFTLLFACIFIFGLSKTAMAVNTPAGTDLTNKATINYDVGGNPQTPKDTNTLTLETDRKLDVLVDEFSNGTHTAAPGDTAANMTANKCLGFNITNESNATLDFLLSVSETSTTDPFSANEDFNTSGCQIRLDDGDNACETSAAGDTAITSIDNLAAGLTAKIWVACTIPGGLTDGDVAAVSLIAKFAETDGTPILTDDEGSLDTPGAIDDVFADGNCPAGQTSPGGCSGTDVDYDGQHSDTDSFTYSQADLTVAKTSVVYSDPINGVSADAKAIPGAVITYTITVTNNGAANATNVVVTDDLTTMVDAGYLAFKTQFNDGVDSCAAGEGIAVSTAGTPCETNAGSDDSADYNITTVKTVTATIGTVASGGGSQTVKFQVTVQ